MGAGAVKGVFARRPKSAHWSTAHEPTRGRAVRRESVRRCEMEDDSGFVRDRLRLVALCHDDRQVRLAAPSEGAGSSLAEGADQTSGWTGVPSPASIDR